MRSVWLCSTLSAAPESLLLRILVSGMLAAGIRVGESVSVDEPEPDVAVDFTRHAVLDCETGDGEHRAVHRRDGWSEDHDHSQDVPSDRDSRCKDCLVTGRDLSRHLVCRTQFETDKKRTCVSVGKGKKGEGENFDVQVVLLSALEDRLGQLW